MPDSDLEARLDAECERLEPRMIRLRRKIHRHPELGWEEWETQALLADLLEGRGLKPTPIAGTGLLVDIGEGDAPVLLRADLDALPIPDGKHTGHATCVSEVDGVSHACGHDAHTAIVAGLALAFATLRDALPGRIRVLFQPAEEVYPSGGAAVARDGVADGARAALALHCDPTRDVGTIGVWVGPLTSISDAFHVRVVGQAGHAARPHLARDAVAAAAEVVQALYGVVQQLVDPLDPTVLSVGKISGGLAYNIIAERVEIGGNIRCFNPEVREPLHDAVRETAEAAARLHRCSVETRFEPGSPSVVNDAALHEVVTGAVRDVLGANAIHQMARPSTGSEDFGHLSARVPTYMLRLGVRRPDGATLHLHTPVFDLDERALVIGMRVLGRAALRVLAGEGPAPNDEEP